MSQKRFSSIFSIQSSILLILLISLTLNSSCKFFSNNPPDPCQIVMERCETLEAQPFTDRYTISLSRDFLDTFPNTLNLQNTLIAMYDSIPGESIYKFCGCGLLSISVDDAQDTISIEDIVASAESRLEQNGEMGIAELDYPIDNGPGSLLPPRPSPWDKIRGIPDTVSYRGQVTTKSKKVKVAIIDTGTQADHSDFTNLMWINEQEEITSDPEDEDKNCYINDHIGWDFVNDEPYLVDHDGHGTHVAGIVQKRVSLNDEIGLQIINLKIMEGSQTSLFNGICAITYAMEQEADIINLSWGYYSSIKSEMLKELLNRVKNKKIIVVTSAGNDNMNVDCCKHWPSGFNVMYNNILSVAALGSEANKLANYSNYGLQSVDIAAPGTNIESAYPPNRQETLSGTSMAAPFVTGELAKIIADNDQTELPSTLINQLIENNTSPLALTFNGNIYQPKAVKTGKYINPD